MHLLNLEGGKTVQIDVVEGDAGFGVFVDEGEGGTEDGFSDAQGFAQTLDKGSFAGTQVSLEEEDRIGGE